MAKSVKGAVVVHRGFWFIGLEFVAIVFGVFLGGYLSERRSQRELDDLIARSRVAIQAEMETNYREILRSRAYQIERYDDLVALSAGRVSAQEVFAKLTKGFFTPQIQTGNYDAAVAAGLVVYFDSGEFAQISRAYSVAQLNEDMDDIYVAALVNDQSEGRRIPSIMLNAFRQFITGEDAALQVLGPLIGEEPPARWQPAQPEAGPPPSD